MSPTEFVSELKQSSAESVDGLLQYVSNPPVPDPPEHLGKFVALLRSLSQDQRRTPAELLQYSSEGILFDLLGYLDNTATLRSSPSGQLELWYIDGEQRTLLNAPDGPAAGRIQYAVNRQVSTPSPR